MIGDGLLPIRPDQHFAVLMIRNKTHLHNNGRYPAVLKQIVSLSIKGFFVNAVQMIQRMLKMPGQLFALLIFFDEEEWLLFWTNFWPN